MSQQSYLSCRPLTEAPSSQLLSKWRGRRHVRDGKGFGLVLYALRSRGGALPAPDLPREGLRVGAAAGVPAIAFW